MWPARCVNTTQQVGGSLGTALLNTVATGATASFVASHGPASLQKALVHGYTQGFMISAILLLIAAAVSWGFISPGVPEVHDGEIAPAVA